MLELTSEMASPSFVAIEVRIDWSEVVDVRIDSDPWVNCEILDGCDNCDCCECSDDTGEAFSAIG